MKKVLLVFPPFTQPINSKKRCLVPLGISYIAAYLREKDIDVKILDSVVEGYYNEVKVNNDTLRFGLPFDEIKKRIEKYKPDFVGVSCLMTTQIKNALMVCKLAKQVNTKTHTVLGGCHPSVFPEKCLSYPYVDSVVIGEGEQAMLDIIEGKKQGIIQNEFLDIDTIPEPTRGLLPMEKYQKINAPQNVFTSYRRITNILTSRGCPFNCVYCATTTFHGAWRGRKPENVIEEVRKLKDKYKIQEFDIQDENFVLKRDRVVKILEGFRDLNIAWSNPGGIWIKGLDNNLLDLMKESGCFQLTFPVESSNPQILKDVINKPLDLEIVKPLVEHCKKIGIDTHAFFVCGFPEETKQDMINDYEFAKDVGFDSATFNIVTPLPGSRIYEKYKGDVDLNRINYIKATIQHPTMSSKEIEELVRNFNMNFNKALKWRRPIKYVRKYWGAYLKRGISNAFVRQ